jgi:TPR repeat protein
LKQVVESGERSLEVTYQHALGGSPTAQFVYGTELLHGSYEQKSASEGLFWLVRACSAGCLKAALVLASAFLEGHQTKKNTARAMKYATIAADGGLPEGAFFLANLLIGVEDFPEDHARAVALLQSAAQSGYLPAIAMLNDNNIPLSPQ